MWNQRSAAVILLGAILFSPLFAYAEAVTILSGGADARNCFFAAQMASRLNRASNDDIATCTRVLRNSGMKPRDRAATYVNRGVLYGAQQNFRAAIRDYEKAQKLNPDFGETHVNLGNIYFIGEAYQRAIQEYDQAIALNIKASHIAYLNRGMAYQNLGEWEKAAQNYRQALLVSPKWQLAQTKLDILQAAMEKRQRAAEKQKRLDKENNIQSGLKPNLSPDTDSQLSPGLNSGIDLELESHTQTNPESADVEAADLDPKH